MRRHFGRALPILNHVFLLLCVLTILGMVIGFVRPPSVNPLAPSARGTLVAWVRLGLSLATAIALVFGPGFAIACLRGRPCGRVVGYLALVGPAMLAAVGLLSWGAAGSVGAHRMAAVILLPVVAAIAVVAATRDARSAFDGHDVRAFAIVAVLLAVVAAKGIYSLGPTGELYHGLISRTLEVGDRGDSRIPYHVVQLVANGTTPFSPLGEQNFLPWSFSDRGPLAGLAASPVVLLAGAQVPTDPPNQPWALFDPQGFSAYRLVMMTLAVTALLAVYGIMRRLAGAHAALFTTILTATTPFVVHESFFTWPKLLTAGMVLLSADLTLQRRAGRAGLMAGIGYLVHPMALVSAPTLALLTVQRGWGSSWTGRARRIGGQLLALGAGVGTWIALWRVINVSHDTQGIFLSYPMLADNQTPASVPAWLAERWQSVLNTLVPLHMYLLYGQNPEVNVFQGMSPPIVHFFFLYWNTLPFAAGILFFPVLLVGLARVARRHPWSFVSLVVVPFVAFAIYWGFSVTGLMREGLHVWLITLLMLYGYVRFNVGPLPWERSWLGRGLISYRALESLVMMLLPTVVTNDAFTGRTADIVPLALMVLGLAWLGRETWLLSRIEETTAVPTRAKDAFGRPAVADPRSTSEAAVVDAVR